MRVARAADHAGCAFEERLRAHLPCTRRSTSARTTRRRATTHHALAAGVAVFDGGAGRAILGCGRRW